MTALLSLFSIFGYATIFNIFFKRLPSVSIFFSITFIISILFIFGMLDQLKYGAYGLFYLGIVFLIYSSVRFYGQVMQFFTSVPVVIYTLMSAIYLYMMQDAQFFFWDEYSHWGASIKEMFYFDTYYDKGSMLSHLFYPPGIQTWDYFIIKNTVFSEGNVYFSYFLLLFSATLSMFEKLSFKEIHWIMLILLIQAVVFASFGHWFSCTYVDHVIGSMFAGLVLSYLSSDFQRKELFLFIFPLITIVLVKEIGLYFGLAFLGLVLFLEITRHKLQTNSSLFKSIKQYKLIMILAFLFLVMVIVLQSWDIRQKSMGMTKGQQSISGITKSIFSNKKVLDSEKEQEVKKRFWHVVFDQQLHKEKVSLNYNEFSYGIMPKFEKPVKLTTVGVIVFFFFTFIIALLTYKEKAKRIEISIIYGYISLITIIYLFILYFSFQVAFGNGALRIPSYVRYMNIAVLPMFFISFSLMLPFFKRKDKENLVKSFDSKSFIGIVMVLGILYYIINPYFKPMYSQLTNSFRTSMDDATTAIVKNVPPKSKLFVVFPIKNNGSLNNIVKYTLLPAKVTLSKMDFETKSFQEMLNIYSQYDYIWFSHLNQKIFDKNRNILRGKADRKPYTLYKIEKKSPNLSLVPVI